MIQQFNSGYIVEENEITISNIYLLFHVHNSIIYNSQYRKQPKGPLMNKWIKKRKIYTHIYLMAYYSVIRNKGILPFATTWMKTKSIC